MTTGVGDTLTMGYDGLRRLTSVTGGPFNRSYAYRDISGTATTLQVSQLSYPNLGSGVSFGYTYDSLGNIATYTAPDGQVITYSYDNQGQLLKAEGDATYTYAYDSVGNILTANGHTYSYGDVNWKDLLTAFDGNSITYDASGNPTSYYNGTRWTMTWENGRSLATATDGTNNLSFTYDTNGLRTSKKVGSVTHKYLYASGKLMRETYGSNTLDFFYDANGTPYAMKYNGTVYYYVTNLQGDVIRVVDASGNAAASYDYDPYGNVISATGTLAGINPIRYRGYYYDAETGFYYLQSRYYDPATGRFVNADFLLSIGKGIIYNNIFAYCLNNPIKYLDASGDSASLPPMIENGLNLPSNGGLPVVINGITYYYAIEINNGELFEYWFDAEGNLIWGRHHSNHRTPWKHNNPHDHRGGKDKDGNNTLVGGPQPVDEKFHGPDQLSLQRQNNINEKTVYGVGGGLFACVVVYQVAKWAIATIFAPATGGGSYVFAALTP